MAAPKGNKFTTGRPAGIPNKLTTDTRKAYQLFVEGNLDNLQIWLEELKSPSEKLEFMLKFSEYFVPKLGRIEHTGADGEALQLNVIQFNQFTHAPRLEPLQTPQQRIQA